MLKEQKLTGGIRLLLKKKRRVAIIVLLRDRHSLVDGERLVEALEDIVPGALEEVRRLGVLRLELGVEQALIVGQRSRAYVRLAHAENGLEVCVEHALVGRLDGARGLLDKALEVGLNVLDHPLGKGQVLLVGRERLLRVVGQAEAADLVVGPVGPVEEEVGANGPVGELALRVVLFVACLGEYGALLELVVVLHYVGEIGVRLAAYVRHDDVVRVDVGPEGLLVLAVDEYVLDGHVRQVVGYPAQILVVLGYDDRQISAPNRRCF